MLEAAPSLPFALWIEPRSGRRSQILENARGFLPPHLGHYAQSSAVALSKAEILSLAEEFLTRYSTQFDRPKPVLCKESIQHLMEHSWPGNLPGAADRHQDLCRHRGPGHLACRHQSGYRIGKIKWKPQASTIKGGHAGLSIQIERQLISEVLVSTGGNRKRAAAELGISYKALLYKLKQIESERPSASSKTSRRMEPHNETGKFTCFSTAASGITSAWRKKRVRTSQRDQGAKRRQPGSGRALTTQSAPRPAAPDAAKQPMDESYVIGESDAISVGVWKEEGLTNRDIAGAAGRHDLSAADRRHQSLRQDADAVGQGD